MGEIISEEIVMLKHFKNNKETLSKESNRLNPLDVKMDKWETGEEAERTSREALAKFKEGLTEEEWKMFSQRLPEKYR